MKKVVFYVMVLPIAALMFVFGLGTWLIAVYLGLFEVVDLLANRFEYWAFDAKRGVALNCPWKTTVKEAFMTGYRGETFGY